VEQPFLEEKDNGKLRNTAEFMKFPLTQKATSISCDPGGFQLLGSNQKKALQDAAAVSLNLTLTLI